MSYDSRSRLPDAWLKIWGEKNSRSRWNICSLPEAKKDGVRGPGPGPIGTRPLPVQPRPSWEAKFFLCNRSHWTFMLNRPTGQWILPQMSYGNASVFQRIAAAKILNGAEVMPCLQTSSRHGCHSSSKHEPGCLCCISTLYFIIFVHWDMFKSLIIDKNGNLLSWVTIQHLGKGASPSVQGNRRKENLSGKQQSFNKVITPATYMLRTKILCTLSPSHHPLIRISKNKK